jgi:uncharacterized protein
MLIDLEQLPDEGKYLSVEFHAQYNEKLFNIKLFEGYIFRNRSDFLLEGKLSFDVEEFCDRCLIAYNLSVSEQISVRLTENIYKDIVTKSAELKLTDEDLNAVYIESLVVEINDIILKEAESLRPMRKLCQSDCKGLCANCGINYNIATCNCKDEVSILYSLGELKEKYNRFPVGSKNSLGVKKE